MSRKAKVIVWALSAALAGFLFGFDTAVIAGAEQAVQRVWNMSDVLHGLAISAALWGTVIGALIGSVPSDAFGRKKTLIVIGLLYAASALGSAIAWDPFSFMAFRFIGGLGVGASSIAAPGYIAEIAPREQRGKLVALFQTMIVIGILIAYLSNYWIGGSGPDDWRFMLGVDTVPALLFVLGVLFLPESPRWLVLHKGRREEALAILRVVSPEDPEAVLRDVTKEERSVSAAAFFSGKYHRPILLALLIAFFNQLSGINAIIYYAPRIFEQASFGTDTALLATIGIGAVNLVFTLIGLALIDRAGRKSLMYIGSFGYIVSLSMVAYGFAAREFALVPIFLFAFIAAHAIGQGAVLWAYISEIFPNAARAKGQALGAATHWICAAALTLIMPAILASVPGQFIFTFFAGLMLLQLACASRP